MACDKTTRGTPCCNDCGEKRPQLTVEGTIAELKRQRAEFVTQVADGQVLSQIAIDYIDGMLAQLAPGHQRPVQPTEG